MDVRLSRGPVRAAVVTAVLVLLGLHSITQVYAWRTGDRWGAGLVRLFDIGAEKNLPTLYAVVTIALCSAVFFRIASAERAGQTGLAGYWRGLGFVFGFLAVDEALGLHERTIEPVRALLNTSGVLFYAWVVPYGVFAAGFALAYIGFLCRLPRAVAGLFVLAGIVFVAGAVGCEMFEGREAETAGKETLRYALLATAEETLEMAGIALLLDATLLYIDKQAWTLRVRSSTSGRRPPALVVSPSSSAWKAVRDSSTVRRL